MKALSEHGVKYVLVGALAARLQGFLRLTADANITPARDSRNRARLAAALKELDARVYARDVPAGLAFDFTEEALSRAEIWNLATAAGRLDIAFSPSGTEGYADLVRGAVRFEVFGTELLAACLEDIIRSKEAADRAKDRQDVAILRAMLRGEPEH